MSEYIDEIFNSHEEEDDKDISQFILNHFREKIGLMLIRHKTFGEIENKSPKYNNLVVEARELYFQGFFYSCVVTSCLIAEYILRDLFFDNVDINTIHLSKKLENIYHLFPPISRPFFLPI